jgi:hypothetical protein
MGNVKVCEMVVVLMEYYTNGSVCDRLECRQIRRCEDTNWRKIIVPANGKRAKG